MRLAVLTTHPVQYYAPLFRKLSEHIDLHVFYGHRARATEQAAAGFDTAFDWDIDLLSGYNSTFLANVAKSPSPSRFSGCDTPSISQELLAGRFDATLSLGWHVKSLLQGMFAAKRLGVPLLVRGDSQLRLQPKLHKRLVKKVIYPPLLRLCDAALFVGIRNREYYEHFSYPEDRLFFSPHAVDNAFFEARSGPIVRCLKRNDLGVSANTKLVLFAGKLVDFKRPNDVVLGVAKLRATGMDVQLLVAGSGRLEKDMRAKAAEFKVPAHFLGFVNQTGMPAVYAAADVLVVSSSSRETWGLVANEALASGTRVVVSDAAGSAPDLCDGQVGHSFSCGDVDGLSDKLRIALASRPSPLALKQMTRRYSLHTAAKGVIEAADKVIKQV